MSLMDDPNREVLGLAPVGATGDEPDAGGEPDLDAMTKDQLLEVAEERGLEVNASMTKAEIREVIDKG